MAYKLDPREGMATGVRRILDEELTRAMAALEGCTPETQDAAVHNARKRLKKSRSALRLARDDIGNGLRRPANVTLRNAGRRLSGLRDADVLLETLTDVEQHSPRPLPAAANRRLRAALERDREEYAFGASGMTSDAAAELDRLRRLIDRWPLDDESFAAAEQGLRRIHARGRKAMDKALERGDDASWHAWRKRVKDLWYALRILTPVAPGQLKGPRDEADALSDLLGDLNDIAVLRRAVESHGVLYDEHEHALMLAALALRRDELRLRARPLGRRLYAESPKRFARRVAAYWDARDDEQAAAATWLEPAVAEQVRALLEEKQAADTAGKRRISARLRELGFRSSALESLVPRAPGGFGPDQFDALVERGDLRIGSPAV